MMWVLRNCELNIFHIHWRAPRLERGENDRNDGRVSRVKVGSRNRVASRISTIRKAAVVAAMALVLAKASGITKRHPSYLH